MQITPSVSVLPLCSFGTLSWPVSSSNKSSSSWETSLRSLSKNNLDGTTEDSDVMQQHLIQVLRCALERSDLMVARDSLQFLAALEIQQQQQQQQMNPEDSGGESSSTVHFANQLLLAGLMAAAEETLQFASSSSSSSSSSSVHQQPLLPAKFDLVRSNCSAALGAVKGKEGFSDTVEACRSIMLAEAAICRGQAASAEVILLAQSGDSSSSSSSSSSPLLSKWISILLLLSRYLQGKETSAAWSETMLRHVTSSQEEDEAENNNNKNLSAQLRFRAAFLLFDADFFAEHLFLSATPLRIRAAAARVDKARSSKPTSRAQSDIDDDHHADDDDAAQAAAAASSINSASDEGVFAKVLFPPEPETGNQQPDAPVVVETDALRIRLSLRVARAKVVGFISSSLEKQQQQQQSSSSSPSDLNAAVDTCLSILNNAQRRVAPPSLQVAFTVVMQEALESICHLTLCCLLKLIFIAQSQVGVLKILAHDDEDEPGGETGKKTERASLVGFVKSFIQMMSSSTGEANDAHKKKKTMTVSLSSLQAVTQHLHERVQQVVSLRRYTAATKCFESQRLSTMEKMVEELMHVLGSPSRENKEQEDEPFSSSSSTSPTSGLIPLLEVTSSERHSAAFAIRLQLRVEFLQRVRFVPAGDGTNVRIVLRQKQEAPPLDEAAKHRAAVAEEMMLKSEVLNRERRMFAKLFGI